jgi:hypothetical protein
LALILTADSSLYLTELNDFDCGLFRSLNLDTLIFEFEMGLTAGVTGQQGMLIPPSLSFIYLIS